MEGATSPLSSKQIIKLIVIGTLIVCAFFLALAVLFFKVEDPDLFLAIAPFCYLPYVITISSYAGFFMAKLAKGNGRRSWLWAIIGFGMTLGFIFIMPTAYILFEFRFPHLFSISPAAFSFLAPFLSISITALMVKTRRKLSRIDKAR